MGDKTHIEWTEATFNPWVGCTKVSPGCANCYAETEDKRRGWTPDGWGKGKPRKRTSAAYWKKPLQWNNNCLPFRDSWGDPVRQRVFCASLADWLDDEVPIEWLADLLALIYATPRLDWQLLTKRPANWKRRLQAADAFRFGGTTPHECGPFVSRWLNGDPPPNVWAGISAEDQDRFEERVCSLLHIPAAVRFVSFEPLLGPIDATRVSMTPGLTTNPLTGGSLCSAKIHWAIIGGESGPKARPCDVRWIRDLVDQCVAAGVATFVKQLGAVPVSEVAGQEARVFPLRHRKGGDWNEWPEELRVREMPIPAQF